MSDLKMAHRFAQDSMTGAGNGRGGGVRSIVRLRVRKVTRRMRVVRIERSHAKTFTSCANDHANTAPENFSESRSNLHKASR